MKVTMIVAPALIGALVGTGAIPARAPERPTPAADSLEGSVEAALQRGDLRAAVSTTHVAYRRATRSHRWESLVEVGDAYSRIASQTGAPDAASGWARESYHGALYAARRAESLDGVLRAAEGFAQLGDVHDTELSLDVAHDLAGADGEAASDVKATADRLSVLLRSGRMNEPDDD